VTTPSTLVLVELADGNYVPIPEVLARRIDVGFAGLDADGNDVAHPYIGDGPANPRAYPPPFLDGDDYLASMSCTECGDVRDDLARCDSCNLEGCTCLVQRRSFDCGVREDGLTLCDDCTPFHGGCPQCDPPGPHD
jgi:hypothetical protein